MPTIPISTAADAELVAAPGAGKRIRVTAFMIQFDDAAGTNLVNLKSATTSLTGALIKSCAPPLGPDGILCGADEALNIDLTGSFTVTGFLTYSNVG